MRVTSHQHHICRPSEPVITTLYAAALLLEPRVLKFTRSARPQGTSLYSMKATSKISCIGLAAHPTNENVFATAGDDCTIRIWDMHEKRMLKKVTVDTMCRAIDWSPDGTLLGCGLGGTVGRGRQKKDGAYVVISTDSMSVVHQARDSREYISDAKFSPDGKTLGLGSYDNKVYLYAVDKDFALRAKCEKHHSYITHFDFSDDSTYLQSNCGGYELQFFSVIDGEHVHSASITKDCEWHTQTSTLGWAIQVSLNFLICADPFHVLSHSHSQNLYSGYRIYRSLS